MVRHIHVQIQLLLLLCFFLSTETAFSVGGSSVDNRASAPFADIATTITNETCVGNNDGVIDFVINNFQTPTVGAMVTIFYSDGVNTDTQTLPIPSSGSISGTFTGVPPSTYQLFFQSQTTESGNTAPFTVAAGGASFQFTPTLPSCQGASDGSVMITATGGIAPYTFSLGAGRFQTSNMFAGLAAGTYSFNISDASGCVTTQSFQLTEPNAISITSTTTDILCNGEATGAISISASGGTAPYEYSYDGGTTFTTSNTMSSLTAGAYAVVVKDANDCNYSETLTITELAAVTASVQSTTDITCHNENDGTILLNVAGGNGNYVIQGLNANTGSSIWQTLDSDNTIKALDGGVWTFSLSDDNYCSNSPSFTVTINNPDALELTGISGDFMVCFGESATISVIAQGGTAPYTYSNDGGSTFQNSATFSNLAVGSTHSFVVKDANNCIATNPSTNIQIFQLNEITATITPQDISCFGLTDGSISISAVSGGTSVYQYSLDGTTFQSSPEFTGLTAGNYTVYIKDTNNCSSSFTTNINEPAEVIISANVLSNVSCGGGNDGSVEISATNTISPVTYSINGGTAQSSNVFTGLTAGNYSVQVSSGPNSCIINTTFTITQPVALSSTSTDTNASCNGGADGAFTINASGGTAPYQYTLDGTNFQASNEFTGLTAATYLYRVVDANNCEFVGTAIVSEPSPITITYLASPPSCIGDTDGLIQINLANGGTGPIQIRLQGTTTPDFSIGNLSPGNYMVEAIDGNGCTVTNMVTVPEAQALTADVTVDANASGCGNTDGAFTISNTRKGSQSIPTVEYSIDGQNYQSSPSFTGLAAGVYTVNLRDITPVNQSTGNCEGTVTVNITEPSGITGMISSTNLTCNADMSGTVTVSGVTGGVAPYTYSLDGVTFVNTATFSSLAAGNYDVTVRDNGGCTTILSTTISEPSVLSATFTTADITCNGADDGAISLVITGGTAPYTFTDGLTQGGTPQAVSGNSATFDAPAGTRTSLAGITDANGCTFVVDFTINEPDELTAAITNVTDPTCPGASDGTITITTIGGTAPYEASSDGTQFFALASDGIISGIGATTIDDIIVRDANGCEITIPGFTTTDPAPITADLNISNLSCHSAGDGSITITPTSTTSTGFEYSLDGTNFQSNSTFDLLTAGTYTITVREMGVNCTKTFTAEVTEPDLLVAVGSAINISCSGLEDGQIIGNATGGTAPYEYSLDGGTTYTTDAFTDLDIGNYNLLVRDANGCTATEIIILTAPDELDLTISNIVDVSCYGLSDGSASQTVTGGTMPYSYSLDGTSFSTSVDLSALTAGNYVLFVRDANDCLISSSFVIDEPDAMVAAITSVTDATCHGAADGGFAINVMGGQGSLSYSLDGSAFSANNTFTGLSAGMYTVTIRDGASCETTISQIILEPMALELRFETADISCNGASDGQIAGLATGGTAPYSYSLDGTNFQSTVFENLSAGSYTLTAKDANDCSTTTSITISEPDALVAQVSAITNVDCNGNNTGSAMLGVTGGSAPYTYSTDGSSFNNSVDLASLSAGSYSITIRDVNNCETTANFSITEPDVLSLSLSTSNVSCFGTSDGSINPTAMGGTAPYEYSLDGTNFQAGNFESLTAGSYTITLRDANACTATETITISEPDLLQISLQTQQTTCNGDADGSIIPSAIGGTAPYEYSLDGTNFQAGNFTNLAAGDYSVTLRDANGCTTTANASVGEPDALTAVTAITLISCFGESDGTIDLIAIGGTAPYQYSLDGTNFQMSGTFNGLSADTYTVTIQDANGCSTTLEAEVIQPAELTLAAIFVNDNTITAMATGGIAPYEYQLNSGDFQSSTTFSGLSNGEYNITVRDANGCIATTTESFIVTSVDNPLIPVEVKAYPNPAEKHLTFSRLRAGDNIRTVSLSGNVMNSLLLEEDHETYQMDISGIRQKLFLVIVTDQKGRVRLRQKIMKKE